MAIAKSHMLRRNIRFVFLDYLQLIRLVGSRDDRWEQLITISEGMKEIARMGVSVIALSQLAAKAIGERTVSADAQAGSYGIIAPTDYAVTVQNLNKSAGNKESKEKLDRGVNFVMNVSKSRFGWDSMIIDCVFDRGTQRIREAVA